MSYKNALFSPSTQIKRNSVQKFLISELFLYGIHCFYTIYTKITSQLLLLPDQQGDCLQRIGKREHVHAHALRHTVTFLLKIL